MTAALADVRSTASLDQRMDLQQGPKSRLSDERGLSKSGMAARDCIRPEMTTR
jgi:hypothetical protein